MDQRGGSAAGKQAILASCLWACEIAMEDFSAAVHFMRPIAAKAGSTRLLECGMDLCVADRLDDCACFLYLLAAALSREIAAASGNCLIIAGNRAECLIMAQSDLIDTSTNALAAVSFLEHHYDRGGNSLEYLIKLADHYRNAGQSFMTERLLVLEADSGSFGLIVRLAEHWIEFQEWSNAFQVLRTLPRDYTTAETVYMFGRSATALLMADYVQTALRRLQHIGGAGAIYAELLSAVWEWRIGNETKALARCPNEQLLAPLIERDRRALAACHASDDIKTYMGTLSEARAGPKGAPDLPNVLMIGMQRTATSWFWQVFGAHEDVQPMTFKETTFFNEHFRGLDLYPVEARDADIGETAFRYWEGPTRSMARFRRLYRDGLPIRMDVSPSYAELPPTTVMSVCNILGSETKIIVCFRDPVERTWSNLKLDQKLIGRKALDLSFDQRKAFYDSDASRRRSEYSRVCHIWRRRFQNFKIVLFDDILDRPFDVINDVCRFLEIDPGGLSSSLEPAYMSDLARMPHEDRAYLFERFATTYDDCENTIGDQAFLWRQKQFTLLSQPGS